MQFDLRVAHKKFLMGLNEKITASQLIE
jgi:hypothetical protein